jgi:hypothetical protein
MQNRPLRPFEHAAHLHVLDWAHDTARQRFQAAGAVQVKAASKAVVAGRAGATLTLPSLEAAVHGELRKLYALGHATVRSELDHQATGRALTIGLSASVPEAFQLSDSAVAHTIGQLRARAQLAASAVAHAIWQAIARGKLQGITDQKTLRTIGRDAGNQQLGAQASHHAGGAINAGRHAAALTLVPGGRQGGPRAGVAGARYTSVLDKNTCQVCEGADDGVLRTLDDPALIRVPNPACLGGDRCRCIWVYQLSSEVGSKPAAIAAGR